MIQLLARMPFALRFREEDGQTLVEYALILVFVSVAAVTLLSALGAFPASVFNNINGDF
jgi:Flp pilus assembly pilin Flp